MTVEREGACGGEFTSIAELTQEVNGIATQFLDDILGDDGIIDVNIDFD